MGVKGEKIRFFAAFVSGFSFFGRENDFFEGNSMSIAGPMTLRHGIGIPIYDDARFLRKILLPASRRACDTLADDTPEF